MNHPVLLILLTGAALYLAKLWVQDLRANTAGMPPPLPLPGSRPATLAATLLAISGTLVLLGIETLGELILGYTTEQSRMSLLMVLYSVSAAPVIEEIIFRGWLVIENRGRFALWAGAIGASILFAGLHPFLWRLDSSGLNFTPTPKAWFSSCILFATSMWLYAARFGPWNPTRSLLPCFVGHAAKNIGVVLIKGTQGYLVLP